MPRHQDLTGSDLHEPKGVDAASANTVYLADGSGSGSWGQIPTAAIGTSVKNLNREHVTIAIADIGTVGSVYLGIGKACSIAKITVTLQGTTATASTILTFRNDAGTSMGTATITSGSTAGAIGTLTPVSNNTFVADTKLQIDSDGGTSTTAGVVITIELVWT